MKQFRAKGGGGVRERSSTIVTSKYGTSTGIHKIDTDMKQCRVKGGGGGEGVREQSSTIVTSKYGTSTGIHKIDRYEAM